MPLFSTILVVILLIASMVAFARLIQGINDLQVQNVLQAVGRQGRAVICTLFQRHSETDSALPEFAPLPPDPTSPMQRLTYSGEPRVVTWLDVNALVRLAEAAGAVVVVECAVGDTLVEDALVLSVCGAAAPLPERPLMRAIHLGATRTFAQDPKYAIRLLVDIAIRALSPAINHPTTAVQALDQIEDLLRHLAHRHLDAGRAHDAGGALRLVFPMPTWEDYLALSFDEIRQFGATSIQVMRRLRSALTGLSESVATEERRAAVRLYLDHLNRGVGRSVFDELDRATALQEDRQGLGLSRERKQPTSPSGASPPPRTMPTPA